jgi:hypothetical protein
MNIMITDLRMTQDNGGVAFLDGTNNQRVDVRVPVAFGVVCQVHSTKLVVAMTPVDSFQLATMKYGGFAVRDANTGVYSYFPGGTMTTGNVSDCHGGGVGIYADTITMGGRQGSVVEVTGDASAVAAVGGMAMVWQTVNYSFAPSKAFSGRLGLFRITTDGATIDSSELVAPFSTSARFSYFTNPPQANDVATTTAPTDLNTVRGLKILLAAEASDTVPGYTGPKKSPLTTAVFFKNTRIQ